MKRSHDVDYFMLPLVSEKDLCNTLSVWLQMRGLDTPDVRILFQKSLIEIDAKQPTGKVKEDVPQIRRPVWDIVLMPLISCSVDPR